MTSPDTKTAPADAAEDRADRAAFDAARADERLPAEVVDCLLDGESPAKVWRRHRGLTVAALAARLGCSCGYLSEIENDAKDGSLDFRRRLAAALGVNLDDLERLGAA